MKQCNVVIQNIMGVTVQPAGKICDVARSYSSDIKIVNQNRISSAKSLLSVVGASLRYGDEVEIICEGEDEKEALQAMVEVLSSPFN